MSQSRLKASMAASLVVVAVSLTGAIVLNVRAGYLADEISASDSATSDSVGPLGVWAEWSVYVFLAAVTFFLLLGVAWGRKRRS